MLIDAYPGETVRLAAKDLQDAARRPVTSGATVTIEVYNPDGTLNQTLTADNGGSGNDWYYDFLAPATLGVYEFKITATTGTPVGKAKESFRVVPF